MATAFRSPADIAGDLSQWMANEGRTQNDVAATVGVTQPQLSRILSGHFSPARSTTVRRLCELAGVPMEEPRPVADAKQHLYQVLNQVWDGSDDDAERIAALLRAAHRLRQPREVALSPTFQTQPAP
jgi:predicted transcriptional regulator